MKTEKLIEKLEKANKKYNEQYEKDIASLKEQLQGEKEVEFENGKWYKNIKTDALYCVTKINSNSFDAYGFNYEGEWEESCSFGQINSEFNHNRRPATDKEVEEALIKEAKKRGFKVGVTVNSKKIGGNSVTGSWGLQGKWPFEITNDYGHTLRFGGSPIYADGVWAEIIDKLELNGQEVTIEDGEIKIGCFECPKVHFDNMVTSLDDHNIDTIHHPDLGDIKVSDLKNLI